MIARIQNHPAIKAGWVQQRLLPKILLPVVNKARGKMWRHMGHQFTVERKKNTSFLVSITLDIHFLAVVFGIKMESRLRQGVYLQRCVSIVPGPSFEQSGWSFEHKAELITLSIGYSDVLQLFHDRPGTAAHQTQSSVIIGFHEVMLFRKPGIIMIA